MAKIKIKRAHGKTQKAENADAQTPLRQTVVVDEESAEEGGHNHGHGRQRLRDPQHRALITTACTLCDEGGQ